VLQVTTEVHHNLEECMPIAYQLLRLETLAQPIAIDGLLGFIKKLKKKVKVLLMAQCGYLLARMFGRQH